jgi:predicted nucleic acid-binding protein
MDVETSTVFAELFQECRSQGRVLSQFDLTIAAVARQHDLILLTADQDFHRIVSLKWENWL